MKRSLATAAWLIGFVVGVAACGDDDCTRPPDASSSDAALPDAAPDAAVPDAALADAAVPDGGPAPIRVVLLAGQSNMVGLGMTAELPPELAAPATDVTIWADGQLDLSVAAQWLPLGPGFGVALDRFGPELTAGLTLEALWPGETLALIKHSIGGTSLEVDWDPDTGPLYAAFRATVAAALAALPQDRRVDVAGLLWMQGESDALTQAAADAYLGRLAAFLGRVRTDLGLPLLPVVLGLISTDPAWVYSATVRTAQDVVAQLAPQVDVIETADLPRDFDVGDPYHYDTTGQMALGQRFAGALAAQHPVAYAFPGDFTSVNGERSWLYYEWDAGTYRPLTWVADHWEGSTPATRIVAGAMHPDVAAAELIWVAPMSGSVTLSAELRDADPSCGDGVRVTVLLDGLTPLWGPVDLPGDDGTPRSFTVPFTVVQNELVSFRTEPLGSSLCDTTAWSVSLDFDWRQ